MMWRLALFVTAVAATASNLVHVYHPSEFDSNELCAAKKCIEGRVCFVLAEHALCVPRGVAKEKLGKHRYIEHGTDDELLRKKHQHELLSETAKHEKVESHSCTRDELDSMGGRLLQWFTDMHRVHGEGRDASLPNHHITCRPDAAWMFEQWDGNQDGFLTMKDDIIIDGQISVDEWCDCFNFADDIRHEPPCHKQKHHADPHLAGIFIPRCDLEGFYQPEQCHSGECWCVDKYGREFDQSRVAGELPDCGQYGTEMSEEEEEELHARL